jgi:ATP-dependent Lon protease
MHELAAGQRTTASTPSSSSARTSTPADAKAVRKTVSGLVKLLHPTAARRARSWRSTWSWRSSCGGVKEQLKKMGAFEYAQTSFSYTDLATGQEVPVGVPEEGGGR